MEEKLGNRRISVKLKKYDSRCVFLIVLLGLISLGSCQRPEIVEDILPEVKRVGMTATLNCTVAKLSGFKVQWSFKNPRGEEIISTNKDIVIVNYLKGGIRDYE
ncbi:I-type lectin-like protein 3 [Plakobranchus ocellatus]|uniref:I-type lectin-like protein 3 n=1 Tax=Plakobranchus ocellatus TaxID=259542 RepID=A0AAV4ANB3_9GAST|nr:I-type lectin-like protein 3 [Plakobranchus ocellatus]